MGEDAAGKLARSKFVFDCLDTGNRGVVDVDFFFATLAKHGLTDAHHPTVRRLLEKKKKAEEEEKSLLDLNEFHELIGEDQPLVAKCFQNQLCLAHFTTFTQEIQRLYEETKRDINQTKPALPVNPVVEGNKHISYLDECDLSQDLDNCDLSADLAVSLCSIDGQYFQLNSSRDDLNHNNSDEDIAFALDGCCYPLVYCAALGLCGAEVVHSYISHEPSGLNADHLSLLEIKRTNGGGGSSGGEGSDEEQSDVKKRKQKPHNPLMNAGAMACCSLISPEKSKSERTLDVLNLWRSACGSVDPIVCDDETDLSSFFWGKSSTEKQLSRNYCLGYMMQDAECFPDGTDLHSTLEFFFRVSAIKSTLSELSIFASTLANGGICPLTNQRVFAVETVHNCLSVMYSCGMGVYCGEWAFIIGLPAKSNVNGAIMVVVPGVMGICSYAKDLNIQTKNSVLGISFFKKLIAKFNFHNYDSLPGIILNKEDPRQKMKIVEQQNIQALLLAAFEGDVWELRRLICRGVNLDSSDYDGRTALHLACSEGRVSAVKFLLKHNVEISPVDRWGGTPLSDAKKNGHTHLVLLLLQSGATDESLLHINSQKYRQKQKKETKEKSTADYLSVEEMNAFYLVAKGDLNGLRDIVLKGDANNDDQIRVCMEDYDKRTLLHVAAAQGHLPIIQFLLEQDIDITKKDRYGNAAISDAERFGHVEIVSFLRNEMREQKKNKLASSNPNNSAMQQSLSDLMLMEDDHQVEDLHDDRSDFEISSRSAAQYLNINNRVVQGSFSIRKLLSTLEKNGLGRDDPRLKRMMDKCLHLGLDSVVTEEQYQYITESGAVLVEKAVNNDLILPNFSQFCDELEDMFLDLKMTCSNDGQVADYIPQLALVDPNKFGLSVCSIDGQRFNVGDAKEYFCVQSVCKPIAYCIALEELGEKKVHYHVGREPSGSSFNELSLLYNRQSQSYRPHNPMINAGAIMTSSLIQRTRSISKRFEYVQNVWNRLAGLNSTTNGESIGFDNSVYLSERGSADRNVCLAYMMREHGCFEDKVNLLETLDFYFMQCSLTASTDHLSVVAGTLANGGICPLTNQRIFQAESVRNCLSLMYSCGMYDYSGEWGYHIGIPGKSGVSGALLLVVPNVMGLCLWSPCLDEIGNTVRGVSFCSRLVQRYAFHNFDQRIPSLQLNKINPVQSKRKALTSSQNNIVHHCLCAAAEGNVDELRLLQLLYDSDLNATDYDGRSALHLACSEGKLEAVKFLVSCGVEVNKIDRFGGTPLSDAIRGNYPEIIQYLRKNMK